MAPKNIKDKMPAPKRRSGVAVAAQRRKGAGAHKNKTVNPWENEHMEMMTLREFREEHGINDGSDMVAALEEWSSDSVVPALCHEGCEVEPDGCCEHGHPSILVRMGVI